MVKIKAKKEEKAVDSESEMREEKSAHVHSKTNPWMIVSLVLAVILVISLFYFGRSSGIVSQDVVSAKILAIAQSQVPDATLKSIILVNGHYDIVISSASQGDIPVSVSSDGNYILQELPGSADAQAYAAPSERMKVSQLDLSDVPSIGNENAPVTVVEFSDFSCPFCVAASGESPSLISSMKSSSPSWEPVVTNLLKDYVQTGKVKFIYVYSMGHSGGHPASLVGWCLNDQNPDLFWKFYALAFGTGKISSTGFVTQVEDINAMEGLAEQTGADMDQLKACIDSGKYNDRFSAEGSYASQVGASGTPAFFINDKLISGAVPYSQVKAAIDAELAQQ